MKIFGNKTTKRKNENGEVPKSIRFQVAILLSLLAGISVYFFLTSVHKTVPVVVATREIAPNTVLKKNDLRTANVSVGDRHRLAFASPNQITGKVTTEAIHNGMQIINLQLAGEKAELLLPGETLLPLTNVVAPPDIKLGSFVKLISVQPEGVTVLGRARLIQMKKDNMAVVAIPEVSATQIIGAVANAKAVYLLVTQGG